MRKTRFNTYKPGPYILKINSKGRINTLMLLCIFLITHAANGQWAIKHIDENSYRTGTVKFKNDSLGLFMGSGSLFLKTTDVGETWSKKQIKIEVNIKDFQFVGDS